eukprot:620915-Prorocentrum_minimum.AAC.1
MIRGRVSSHQGKSVLSRYTDALHDPTDLVAGGGAVPRDEAARGAARLPPAQPTAAARPGRGAVGAGGAGAGGSARHPAEPPANPQQPHLRLQQGGAGEDRSREQPEGVFPGRGRIAGASPNTDSCDVAKAPPTDPLLNPS